MKVLREDTLEQAVARDAEKLAFNGDVESTLDRAYKTALKNKKLGTSNYDNILLVGGQGVGKTARATSWAQRNGINLVYVDAKSLDETDLGGALAPDLKNGKAVKLSTDTLDLLDKPNSVLFLDELNRARPNIRGTLLSLINDHYIYDAHNESGKRKFPNMLFTIAAINPPNMSFTNVDKLDPAELGRFRQIQVIANKKQHLSYLESEFDKNIATAQKDGDTELVTELQREKALAQKILTDKRFDYDGEEEEYNADQAGYTSLSPRTFTNTLFTSDGTKKDFIDTAKTVFMPETVAKLENILADYKDIDDKANSVFKDENGEEVVPGFAKKQENAWDKIMNSGILDAKTR